ncbi:MAG: hypothetical protein JSS29_03310 [Proteobacteria bacterium]|nr:hypothetical protein [Pseudomonadota bacterium]
MAARAIKLLHELGSMGTLGSVAVCLLLLLHRGPGSAPDLVVISDAVSMVVRWVLLPSFIATILSGLLALVATPPYMDSGWAWLKALLSLSLFEASLMLSGTAHDLGLLSRQAAGGTDVWLEIVHTQRTESGVLWVLLGVSIVNVVFGIWRPRLMRRGPS